MGQGFFRWLDSLFPHTHDAETPCNHMKQMLSDLSDDTAGGVKRWYAIQHVTGCTGCSYTLKSLKALRESLRHLGGEEGEVVGSNLPALAPERRIAVEEAWARLDESTNR